MSGIDLVTLAAMLGQRNAYKVPQRQRVRQSPRNPALRLDAFEIADQQRPEVNPRRQRRPPVLGGIKLRTPVLDKINYLELTT
jgi:hypothetical protein